MGPHPKIPDWKKDRIEELTKKGFALWTIAERVGMKKLAVYEFQVRNNLRVTKKKEIK